MKFLAHLHVSYGKKSETSLVSMSVCPSVTSDEAFLFAFHGKRSQTVSNDTLFICSTHACSILATFIHILQKQLLRLLKIRLRAVLGVILFAFQRNKGAPIPMKFCKIISYILTELL